MSRIILVAEASSDLGAATAKALADNGHTVYAGVAPPTARSAGDFAERQAQVDELETRAHTVLLNTADQRSVSTAVDGILAEAGRIDAVVHASGPVPRGPVESFTPFQLAQIYDAHVLSAQRINRSVLPQMRARRDGLLVWLIPLPDNVAIAPYLALHSEAVITIDHLAASYARELAGFGVETTIVTPGSHIPAVEPRRNTVRPHDTVTANAYEGRYPGLFHQVDSTLADQALTEEEITLTAEIIAAVVGSPKGSRPLRITPSRSWL
ncbi:SDR family NAD(P)-dependent oxidoreductase [Streptomyces sp. NPDC001002]